MASASCRSTMVACAPNDGQTAVSLYAQCDPVQQRRPLGLVRRARRRGHWPERGAHRRAALVLVARRRCDWWRRGGDRAAPGAAPRRGAVALLASLAAVDSRVAGTTGTNPRVRRTAPRLRLDCDRRGPDGTDGDPCWPQYVDRRRSAARSM